MVFDKKMFSVQSIEEMKSGAQLTKFAETSVDLKDITAEVKRGIMGQEAISPSISVHVS